MKYILLVLAASILLIVDGTLTYDIFDPKTWSLPDVLILIVAVVLYGTLAWADHTKSNK